MVKLECCKACGFPKHIIRNPVFLDNNFISLFEYEDNTCKECGHQKDGLSIPIVFNKVQKICWRFIDERNMLFRFL